MSMKTPAMSMTRTTVNMKDLYLAAFKRADDGKAAQVLVVDELPDGKNILHAKTDFGYEVMVVKLDTKSKMVGRVLSEVSKIGKKDLLELGMSLHVEKTSENIQCYDAPVQLTSMAVANVQVTLADLSEALQINCPQLVFTTALDSGGMADFDNNGDVRAIVLNPKYNIMRFAVHEFRHAWQRKYHSEMFRNYIPIEECREKYGRGNTVYNSQLAEFDANVFSYAIMNLMFDTPFSASQGTVRYYAESAAAALIEKWKMGAATFTSLSLSSPNGYIGWSMGGKSASPSSAKR